jgi:hypothetical protein
MPGTLSFGIATTYPLVKETPHRYIFYQLPATSFRVGKQQLAAHYHFQSGLRIRSRSGNVRFISVACSGYGSVLLIWIRIQVLKLH